MPEFDHGMKKIAQTTGRQLARIAGVNCQQWGPIESTLQITTEFLSDRAFRAERDGEWFVAYFEFFTTWHSNGRWDMLAKSGLLSQREKLPTMCIPVILQEEGFPQSGLEFRLEVGGNPTQQLWFHEVCLWQKQPEAWWEDVPGLMALFPLCRHDKQPRESIEYAAGVIEQKVVDVGERADFLALLGIFGTLSYPNLDVRRIIGREQMKQSTFYQEIIEEGEMKISREYILGVLSERFKGVPLLDITAAIEVIEDLAQLKKLVFKAFTCENLDAFREALPGQTTHA